MMFVLVSNLLLAYHNLIQVNNTDAEGRLTLADALVYACNQGVDKVLGVSIITKLWNNGLNKFTRAHTYTYENGEASSYISHSHYQCSILINPTLRFQTNFSYGVHMLVYMCVCAICIDISLFILVAW